jgi:succinate dehydrogenase / fumarate reductase, flavoprotein subunit
MIFGKSTMSVICTGGATSRCYQAGAKYGNPEFIQVHPTAIPGEDKCRLISESARGEGGRVWVPAVRKTARGNRIPMPRARPIQVPESERFYFLEERYPKYGNLVPRDIATREISRFAAMDSASAAATWSISTCATPSRSIGRKPCTAKLGGILEIYEPSSAPIRWMSR